MLEPSGFGDSSIGFRFQHASNKALKSWSNPKGGMSPFTQEPVAFMDWLDESGSNMSPMEPIADLSFFAVQTRYDDSVEISSPDWQLLVLITSSLLVKVQRGLT
jgi:hypothetical protein